MTSTETKITFETLPQAVEEIKVELAHLKGTVERLVKTTPLETQGHVCSPSICGDIYGMILNQLRTSWDSGISESLKQS